jgi:hypothetical protein
MSQTTRSAIFPSFFTLSNLDRRSIRQIYIRVDQLSDCSLSSIGQKIHHGDRMEKIHPMRMGHL